MTLEDYISRLNENIFFKEFSFSRNQFSPAQGVELEFADHVIWLDDLFITFQIKRREYSDDHTEASEANWFEKKVLRKATQQIRDTIHFLDAHDKINIINARGHSFDVIAAKTNKSFHMVLYAHDHCLPEKYKRKKFHISSSAGFIHLMSIEDYLGICQTLITPAEIGDYLTFRQKLGGKFGQINILPEQALLGQFLYGVLEAEPSIDFAKYLAELKHTPDEFDLSYIIRNFKDRILNANNSVDYYKILRELAKLGREELKEVKLRFNLSIQNCQRNEYVKPYRVTFPRTGCGFVFVPVQQERRAYALNALQNFTHAHKYEQKLEKCIGVSFVNDGEYYDINYCYIEQNWVHDPDMERILKDNFPFRPVRQETMHRYWFANETAGE